MQYANEEIKAACITDMTLNIRYDLPGAQKMTAKDVPKSNEKDSMSPEKTSQLLKLLEALGMTHPPMQPPKEHKFWNTQPVPKSQEELMKVAVDGPVRSENPVIPTEPCKLNDDSIDWCLIDINDEADKADLYLLLNENYVEDLDAKFRFDYPPNFLDWALKAPGWTKDWHIGVRRNEDARLVAFISAIPTNFLVRSQEVQAVEVNFLCIHKSIRDTRLAPILIKEVTRRVHLTGTFQALYTAGRLLPEPVATARYFHRPLRYAKLYESGFAGLPSGCTLADMNKRYEIVKTKDIKLRPLESKDLSSCFKIFQTYMNNFDMVPKFTEEEFAHWILPRHELLYSFVQENDSGEVVNFVSFYSLPSSVLDSELHSKINVGYLFYYGLSDETSLESLMNAVLYNAKESKFDVFNALDIMQNGNFLKNLKFAMGDGSLHYYLYNWKTSLISPFKVAVAML